MSARKKRPQHLIVKKTKHTFLKVQKTVTKQTSKPTENTSSQRYWKIENTKFGVILKGLEGDTIVPPGMFEEMVAKLDNHGKGTCTL